MRRQNLPRDAYMWLGLVVALALAACDEGSPSGLAAEAPEAGITAPDIAVGDAAGEESEDASDAGEGDLQGVTDPWDPVRVVLDQAVESGRLLGFGFSVRAGASAPSFAHSGGAYGSESLIPTDSSVKPLTGLLVLTLVRDGLLHLDDTLGGRLGWTGPEAAVTVEQLMAFTSGFDGNASCLSPAPSITTQGRLLEPGDRTSLEVCADVIRAGGLLDPPGATFHYGGAHHALLARVVEVAVPERTWPQLFEDRVLRPLGLSPDDVRYTNNRVAGAAVATADAMSRVYEAIAMDLGIVPRNSQSPSLLSPAQARDFIMDRTESPVDRSDSPWSQVPGADLGFALGLWIDCDTGSPNPQDCLLLGSGANGSTSWIDVEQGYVASLTLYQRNPRGYIEGRAVMQDLLPLVRAAVDATRPSPNCLSAGDHDRSVLVDGIEHRYRIHVPFERSSDPALVVQLHGGGSTGAAMDAVSGWSNLADQEGFLVVTPEGWPVTAGGIQVWNAGSCCGPVSRAPNHVEAVAAVIEATLQEDGCLDRGRIFATGHSNGGMMAYRLACELADTVSAVTVSAGALVNEDLSATPPVPVFDCAPTRPVAVLHVHGREDLCAPYEGGSNGGGVIVPGVESVVADWRNRNACEAPEVERQGVVTRTSARCPLQADVQLIAVDGLGHAWAGSEIYGSPERCGGTTSQAVSTTAEGWRFFQDRRRP